MPARTMRKMMQFFAQNSGQFKARTADQASARLTYNPSNFKNFAVEAINPGKLLLLQTAFLLSVLNAAFQPLSL
jgi:hypothetical protein